MQRQRDNIQISRVIYALSHAHNAGMDDQFCAETLQNYCGRCVWSRRLLQSDLERWKGGKVCYNFKAAHNILRYYIQIMPKAALFRSQEQHAYKIVNRRSRKTTFPKQPDVGSEQMCARYKGNISACSNHSAARICQ